MLTLQKNDVGSRIRFCGAILSLLLFFSSTSFAQDIPKTCADPNPAVVPVTATHQTPPYPALSQFAGEKGETVLKVIIAEDGSVSDSVLYQTSGYPRLDDAAVSYVKKVWRWERPMRNCKPTTIETLVNVVWNLKGESPRDYPYIGETLDAADYPPDALRKKEHGIVGVMVSYSETGEPTAWSVVSTSGYDDLDTAAAQIACKRWQFAPMKMNGRPVKSAVFFAMEWKLPEAP